MSISIPVKEPPVFKTGSGAALIHLPYLVRMGENCTHIDPVLQTGA